MSTNQEQLVSLIFRTSRLIHSKTMSRGEDRPCSILQLKTMQFVNEKGNVAMKDIASFFGITPPSATSLINILVKSDYLKRSAKTGDRRVVHLELTSLGEKTLKDRLNKLSARMQQVLSILSDADRENLTIILNKLAKSYE